MCVLQSTQPFYLIFIFFAFTLDTILLFSNVLCGLVNNYRVSISMYLISKTIYMCRNNHTGTSTLTQHQNAIKAGIPKCNATEIYEMLDRWKISTTTMLKIRSMFVDKKSEIGVNKMYAGTLQTLSRHVQQYQYNSSNPQNVKIDGGNYRLLLLVT